MEIILKRVRAGENKTLPSPSAPPVSPAGSVGASACGRASAPGLSVGQSGFSVNSGASQGVTPCLNEAGMDYFYIALR